MGRRSRSWARRQYWRAAVLAMIALLALGGVMTLAPIAQDLAYHDLADKREFFGIPNFGDVMSNLPFFFVGSAGLALCVGAKGSGALTSWKVFFFGVALVSFGSGYYHWAPGNATLAWDRLPMTVAFMGLWMALLSEHVHEKVERFLLAPTMLAGLGSVAWWRYTDDLRFYVWIQFVPLLTIPFMIALFPGRYSHRRYLLYGLGAYALAKIAEFYDGGVMALTGNTVSGHSLKHLLAAWATWFVYLMLARRRPSEIGRPPSVPESRGQ